MIARGSQRLLLSGCSLAAIIVGYVAAAHATASGANGRIVFGRYHEVDRTTRSNIEPVTNTRLWDSGTDQGPATPLKPGARVHGMTLTRALSTKADEKLFDFCDPVILRAGVYRRSCSVPKVKGLFIGYGAFDADRAKLDADWKASRWDAWLDGQLIDLRAFGTFDRVLSAFPPAGGKDATLREWRVTLVNSTRGKHTARYRLGGPVVGPDGGTIDATFVFTVRR